MNGFFVSTAAMLALVSAPLTASSQPHGHQRDRSHAPPVYQRRAFEWMGNDGSYKRGHFHPPHVIAPPLTSGWFQRPYPYHLDYYKMRYGGSYAPYFGNLYGPPQIVTAPPYYGPYYGDYGDGFATPPPQAEYVAPATPTANESLPPP